MLSQVSPHKFLKKSLIAANRCEIISQLLQTNCKSFSADQIQVV